MDSSMKSNWPAERAVSAITKAFGHGNSLFTQLCMKIDLNLFSQKNLFWQENSRIGIGRVCRKSHSFVDNA